MPSRKSNTRRPEVIETERTPARFFVLRHKELIRRLQDKIEDDGFDADIEIYLDRTDRIMLQLHPKGAKVRGTVLSDSKDEDERGADCLHWIVQNWKQSTTRSVLKKAQERHGKSQSGTCVIL